MNPRVFIPKVVLRRDPDTGRHFEAHDLTPAQQYGQLTPVLGFDDNPKYIARLTPKVQKGLADFTHQDYLLAVGDPCLIGLCCGIILRSSPMLTMLKWERSLKMYVKVEIKL